MELDEYLPVLQRTNARFAEAAAEAVRTHGWRARVPGCPDWDVADLVCFLVSERASAITGVCVTLDGGATRGVYL